MPSLIGEDLLVEILKRLLNKTLCRFLCVCKSWKTLISSTLFISLHKSFTCSSTPPNLKPYLRAYGNYYDLYLPCDINPLYFPFETQDDPEGENFTFIMVIHIVVCISYSFKSSFDSTVLWNPSIHKDVTLPWLPFTVDLETSKSEFLEEHEGVDLTECIDQNGSYLGAEAYQYELEFGGTEDDFVHRAEFESSVIGFGYDSSNNDFKVVRIWIPMQLIEPYCKSLLPTYEVYSSRVGTWKSANSEILKSCAFFDESYTSESGCFINGMIHWIIAPPDNYGVPPVVLMFDCESEEFKIVDLPREIFDLRNMEKTELMEYAGMLSVVADSRLNWQSTTFLEMWVMEEHGVATTWKKLYRFNSTCYGFKLCDTYDESFVDLAPYGPKQWTEFRRGYERYEAHDEKVCGHVYEESLFFMDDAEAKCYAEEEVVCI